MDYTLTRSKRKTVALYVRNGKVEVRAPLAMPERDIDKFVASKEKWIKEKLAKSRESLKSQEAFAPNYGDMVLYRGKQCPIADRPDNKISFDGERFLMPAHLAPGQIKSACVQIYRMLAKNELTKKTLGFAKRMGVAPSSIKINGATARWGSCSAKKSINFSWRLIMADDDVIDYVVVHELAHLTEMNHSKMFWAIVENMLPDYKQRQSRLRELQRRLAGEDWE